MKNKQDIIKSWIVKGDHDLGTTKLTYKHIPEYRDIIGFHCQQAVEIRYPEVIIEPTNKELQDAINIADKFREIILSKIDCTLEL